MDAGMDEWKQMDFLRGEQLAGGDNLYGAIGSPVFGLERRGLDSGRRLQPRWRRRRGRRRFLRSSERPGAGRDQDFIREEGFSQRLISRQRLSGPGAGTIRNARPKYVSRAEVFDCG